MLPYHSPCIAKYRYMYWTDLLLFMRLHLYLSSSTVDFDSASSEKKQALIKAGS